MRGGIWIELFEPEEAVVPWVRVHDVHVAAVHRLLEVQSLPYNDGWWF